MRNHSRFSLILSSALALVVVMAITPAAADGSITQSVTSGATGMDAPLAMAHTMDGGLIVAGTSDALRAGDTDIRVVKLDENGDREWAKFYAGRGAAAATAVLQTGEGGYLVAGRTRAGTRGDYDAWLLRLDAGGKVYWDKTYGGARADEPAAVYRYDNGDYLVAGTTASRGAGKSDVWVFRTDWKGNVLWERTFGGAQEDTARDMIPTADGGAVIAGATRSLGPGADHFYGLNADDFSPRSRTSNAYVIRINGQGGLVWEKVYGTENPDAHERRRSCKYFIHYGDKEGHDAWEKTACQPRDDEAVSVAPADGGYIIAGQTLTHPLGDECDQYPRHDVWALRLGEDGDALWRRDYGEADSDERAAAVLANGGGFLLAGTSRPLGHGHTDILLLALDDKGTFVARNTYGGMREESPAAMLPYGRGCVIAGYTSSYGRGGRDFWVLGLDATGNYSGPGAP